MLIRVARKLLIVRLTGNPGKTIIGLFFLKINNGFNLMKFFSSSSSPLSESNDILVGIDQTEADPQTRRLQELGCDLDLLGIDDPIVEPNPTQKVNESSSKQAAIDDLQQLNNVFMQNQFGYQPTQR